MAAVSSSGETPPSKRETELAHVTPEDEKFIKTSTSTSSENGQASKENVPEASEATMVLLSKQLEYYFSAINLAKDTYLRTLRELNDGYVPVAILITFGKVQSICPIDTYNAVVKAAADHSDNLVVVHVDKDTSKRVEEKGQNTLLAVGPKDMKPIELPVTPTTTRPIIVSNPPSPPLAAQIQNTIILRDVAQGVTDDEIRQLFDFEKCPPIQSVKEDVSNYW